MNSNETEPQLEPSIPPSVPDSPSSTTRSSFQRGEAAPVPALDPSLANLYEPATAEDFSSRRLRCDRQETMSYGPQRVRPSTVVPPQPYMNLKLLKPRAHLLRTLKRSLKPFPLKSWTPRFYLVRGPLTKKVTFSSQINLWTSGKFVLGVLFDTTFDLDSCSTRSRRIQNLTYRLSLSSWMLVLPLPSSLMARLRSSQMMVLPQKAYPKTWVGMTIYQISGAARKELCMHVSLPAKKIAKDFRGKFKRVQKKIDKGGVSERHLSLDEKLQFQNAKQKELRSFFENQVWQFDTTANADPSRTLTARMLLKWSKLTRMEALVQKHG